MKNFLLFLLCFGYCLPVLTAQFGLAASGGINFSRQLITNVDSKTGIARHYFAELRPNYALNEKWRIHLGIQYSTKGYTNGDFTGLPNAQFEYLDLLPAMEYSIFRFLSAYGGFNAGITLRERQNLHNKWIDVGTIDNNRIKPLDIGALVGLRAYYRRFFVGVHYNHGLIPLKDKISFTNANGELLDARQFNQNLQVGIGYNFGKSR